MKTFEEQLHTVAQQTRLDTDAKILMREKIVHYMEMKPVRTVTLDTSSVHQWFGANSWSTFIQSRLMPAMLVALLVVSTSAGVSYAAESALPGDTLYPVKVSINEEIVSALMLSQQARVEWLARLAERRLQEASILTSQGRFDAQTSKEVALRFAAHTSALKAETEALEINDPAAAAQVSAEAATNLEAHEAILARLAVEQDMSSSDATELVGQVRVAAKALARLSEDAEVKAFGFGAAAASVQATTSNDESVEGGSSFREAMVVRQRVMARVELDRAYDLLGRIDNQESDSALRTKEHIDGTETAFTQGQEALSQGDYDGAYRFFKRAAAEARTVRQLLDAEVLFDIEILPSAEQGTSSVGKGEDSTDLRDQQVAKARVRAETAIGAAQATLLSAGTGHAKAGNALKEAKAFKLRGDIAVATEDLEDAQYLYKRAYEMAQRVTELLKDVVSTPKGDDEHASEPYTPGSEVPALPPLDVVQVNHAFANGIHTYSGIFVTPTSCFALKADGRIAESYPEQVTLVLTTEEVDPSCPTMELDEKPFSIQVEASEKATFRGVTLNGVPSKFVVIEGAASGSTSTLDR